MRRLILLIVLAVIAAWAFITSPAWLPPLHRYDAFAEPYGDC